MQVIIQLLDREVLLLGAKLLAAQHEAFVRQRQLRQLMLQKQQVGFACLRPWAF